MSITNPTNYYNRFDPTKNYKKLMFLSGAGLQSSELNELQDELYDSLKNIASYLIKNGTVLTGGDIEDVQPTSMTVRSGTVYIDGMYLNVPERAVPITGNGVEIVGVMVTDALVTDIQDPAIREQDPQSPNYQQPGAYRYALSGQWINSSELVSGQSFFPIYTLNSGSVVTVSKSTDTSTVFNNILSRYDNDVHGSYVVTGLGISYNNIDGTTGEVNLNMASGRARVNGVEAAIQFEEVIGLDPISDVQLVSSEPYVYSGVKTYNLRYGPVQNIVRVQGTKSITSTVTHGAFAGTADLLPNRPVLSITSVVQNSTTYIPGTDYIQTGDSVDWSPSGAEPAPGSTYSVTYQYISTWTPATDGTGVIIDAPNAMVNGSTFYVDYNFYLARIDRVSIAQDGSILITKGVPTLSTQVQTPASPPGLLSLATVSLVKNQTPVVTNNAVTIVSFATLQDMQDAISDLQYNVAQLALKDTARDTDPTTTKKGIIVDSLASTALEDLGSTNTAVIDSAALKIATNSTGYIQAATTNGFLPNTDSIVLSNEKYTKDQRINPYATSSQVPDGTMTVSPSVINTSTYWWWFHGSFLPVNQPLTISLGMFNAGEVINVSFRGAVVATVTANSQGLATTSFVLPGGTQNGTYAITAQGVTSGALARGTVTIYDTNNVDYGWDWTGGAVPYGYDPVAETFTLQTTRELTAVSIYLTELPTSPVFVKIVQTTVGTPDSSRMLGIGSIQPSACVIGWNKIKLNYPTPLTGGVEYALIVATAKFQGRVATAQVGGYDNISKTYVTAQAAQGVLLLSANESTWSAVQDEDLTYRLHAATYSLSTTLTLGTISNVAANTTDWNLVGLIDLPAGTSANFYLTTPAGNYQLNLGSPTFIPSFTGAASLMVDLKTTNNTVSPKVFSGMSLVYGQMAGPGIYTMRQFALLNGATTPVTIKVVIDVYQPASSSVACSYESTTNTFNNMSQISSSPLGNNVNTLTFQATGVQYNQSRLRINLNTTDPTSRPYVKNIRVLVS